MVNCKITKMEARMTLLLMLLLEPQYFQSIRMIHVVYKYLGYLALAYIALSWLKVQLDRKKVIMRENGAGLYVIIIFSLWMLYVCIRNNTPVLLYLSVFVPILGVSLWIDYYAKYSVKSTLKCLSFLVNLYIIINFMTVIIWPEGLYGHITEKGSRYACWFLGYKNPQIRFFLPAVAFNLCYDFVRYGKVKLRSILIIATIFITEARLDSSTSLVGLFVFCALYILWGKRERLRKVFEFLKLSYFYIASVIISFLIVVLKIQERFSYVITEVLNRDVTFTNRTFVWEKVLLRIAQNPIFGYGLQSGEVAEYFISATHAHNYTLNLLYTGGIVAFGIITLLWFVSSRSCQEYFHLKSCKILMFICAAFLVMGITEALTEAPLLYPLLVIISNLKFFDEKNIVQKGKQ